MNKIQETPAEFTERMKGKGPNDWMPKKSEEEIQTRIDYAKAAALPDFCGSLIEKITCKLPRHHEGKCEP